MTHTRCDPLKRNVGKPSDFKITLLRSSGAVFSHDEKAKNEYLTVQIIPAAWQHSSAWPDKMLILMLMRTGQRGYILRNRCRHGSFIHTLLPLAISLERS